MPEFVYDKAAVGDRIQAQRMLLHLTQEQLAERLDKSLRFITEIERGAVGMSIETLLGVCGVLKTTPDALLLPNKATTASDLDQLIEALCNCSPKVQAAAMDIVRAYLRSV